MDRDFKLRFDDMNESDPAKTGTKAFFDTPGHARNICFEWPDGRQKFLNYAYLVSGEFVPDESCIILVFTTETILLKGVNLAGLFSDLMEHQRKRIIASDERYNQTSEEESIVNEIVITA